MATNEQATAKADPPHFVAVISRADIRKAVILALAKAAEKKKKP